MPLGDVLKAPRNPKRHDTEMIAKSISHYGIVETPALDERTGRLVAGHGRLTDWERRRDAGEDPPDGIMISADGDWLVPVSRGWASRSDADADAYLVMSNQSTIAGGWDDDVLAEHLRAIADGDLDLLALTGFDDAALDDMLERDRRGGTGLGISGDDDEPEPPDDPITQPGDLWILGRHRVLCGDTTNPDDVDRALDGHAPGVVYTDPPYGIKAVPADGGASRGKLAQAGRAAVGRIGSGGAFGGKKNERADGSNVIPSTLHRQVIGDENTDVAVAAFSLLHGTWPEARHVWWGANHYAADAALPNASCWLVWDKENGASDFADAELAWTNRPGAVRIFRHMWNGMLRASERGPRVHPTQKPVALAVWALDLVDTDRGNRRVFDGFGGSGSTLLACEATDRSAAIIEMDPGYVDVICARWQEMTGGLPQRCTPDGDLTDHDFLATAGV